MTNEYELYHFGVKGMKWGVRRAQKKQLRQRIYKDRVELREKYNKEYGVREAYEKADSDYSQYRKKHNVDPDPDYAEKLYSRAESLSQKSSKQVDSEMRNKYGKDYDDFLKSEQRAGNALVIGGLALSGAMMYGSYKALQYGGKAIIWAGSQAVNKILNK